MSSRPGQKGSVAKYRNKWIGQWLEDVPGEYQRVRKSMTLGMVSNMTKSEARRHLQEHLNTLGVNTPEALAKSLLPAFTFTEAADRYESGRLLDLKPSTQRSNAYHLRAHLRPVFKDLTVEEITPEAVTQSIRRWTKQGLARNTIKNLVATLQAVIGKNFGKTVKYPSQVEVTDSEAPCFTPDQMAQIVGACANQMRVFFATAAGTGMRSGELCGLRVDDVDLTKGIINVRRSAWEGGEQTPKTRNAVRQIGIDKNLIGLLRGHIDTRKVGFVFETRNGTPLRESNILRKHLHPTLATLKIPKCGLHAFRHGRVSFLVENNVPLPVIKLWIGHGSEKMVARYTHARPEFHQNIVAGLPLMAMQAGA